MKKTDSLFKQLHDANEKLKQVQKELDEVRESYSKHTIGCEIWKGSKLLLLDKVKKENEMLLDKLHRIDYIVDREVFDTESNEFKIWKIINKVSE